MAPNVNRNYPDGYRMPRKNVLLVSCMDLRLLDEIVGFMEHDNLTNRYDQFILAGASLSACFTAFSEDYDRNMTGKFEDFKNWKGALFNHIGLAIDLHGIEDIYIMEHRECGAYKSFLKGSSFSTDDH